MGTVPVSQLFYFCSGPFTKCKAQCMGVLNSDPQVRLDNLGQPVQSFLRLGVDPWSSQAKGDEGISNPHYSCDQTYSQQQVVEEIAIPSQLGQGVAPSPNTLIGPTLCCLHVAIPSTSGYSEASTLPPMVFHLWAPPVPPSPILSPSKIKMPNPHSATYPQKRTGLYFSSSWLLVCASMVFCHSSQRAR